MIALLVGLRGFSAVLIVLGIFTTGNGDLDDPTATLLGLPVGSTTIFVIGLVAGVLLLFGFSLTKWGGKHQVKYMKQKRQMRDMAKLCFQWACRRQQMKIAEWHARLTLVKNTAYAWRQMVFFLALLPEHSVTEFLEAAVVHGHAPYQAPLGREAPGARILDARAVLARQRFDLVLLCRH